MAFSAVGTVALKGVIAKEFRQSLIAGQKQNGLGIGQLTHKLNDLPLLLFGKTCNFF